MVVAEGVAHGGYDVNDDCEWVPLPGVFRLSEFVHVTDFDRHFHVEPAWEDAEGEPLFRILQRLPRSDVRRESSTI